MSRNRNLRAIVLALGFLVLAVLACGPLPGERAPSITITSPASGTTVAAGQEVEISSTATAAAGVGRVELSINGQVVRSDTPPDGNPTTFPLTQTWVPVAEGEVTVTVVAYDTSGRASDPATIELRVVPAAAEGEAAPTPHSDVIATATPEATSEAECTLNASYVKDVTIPDDTELAPGTAFVKTWRIRNSGTCDWTSGFGLTFVGGDQMGGPASVPVPATAAGSTADVSVDLVAPDEAGTYRGNWRMQSDGGLAFGPEIYVQIVVPAPPADTLVPTETPTATVTVTPTTTVTPTVAITVPPVVITVPSLPILQPATQQVVKQVSVSGGEIGHAVASCPGSSVVTSGGYAASPDLLIYTHSRSDNGWSVYAKNNSSSTKLLNAYAICLSNVSASSAQRVKQVTVPAGGVGHAIATCPGGSVVTGGGYASHSDGSLFIYNSSRSGNGWQVYARNTSGTEKPFNAYAICLSGTDGTTTQTGDQGSIPAGGTLGVTATCGSGTLLTGGGFAGSTDVFVYNTSMKPATTDTWNTYGRNSAASDKLLNCYAICLSLP